MKGFLGEMDFGRVHDARRFKSVTSSQISIKIFLLLGARFRSICYSGLSADGKRNLGTMSLANLEEHYPDS